MTKISKQFSRAQNRSYESSRTPIWRPPPAPHRAWRVCTDPGGSAAARRRTTGPGRSDIRWRRGARPAARPRNLAKSSRKIFSPDIPLIFVRLSCANTSGENLSVACHTLRQGRANAARPARAARSCCRPPTRRGASLRRPSLFFVRARGGTSQPPAVVPRDRAASGRCASRHGPGRSGRARVGAGGTWGRRRVLENACLLVVLFMCVQLFFRLADAPM